MRDEEGQEWDSAIDENDPLWKVKSTPLHSLSKTMPFYIAGGAVFAGRNVARGHSDLFILKHYTIFFLCFLSFDETNGAVF